MKTNTLFLVLIGFLCVGLLRSAQAVSAAGGYTDGNTALGDRALSAYAPHSSHHAFHNTAIGYRALFSVTSNSLNTAVGAFALENANWGGGGTQKGRGNTGIGYRALVSNTTGNSNIALASEALASNTAGNSNIAVGNNALASNTTGNSNIALGNRAGHNLTTGSDNIYIGNNLGVADESNTIRIGDATQTTTFIAGIRGTQVTGMAVQVDGDGQLGIMASSERFKKNISSMEKASEGILSLRPVTFNYKSDEKGLSQFGLIAEEVAKVNPALVLPDKEGKPYTVRYEAVNAMLLNEFLKEHQKVEEQDRRLHQQGAMIAQQQKQIEALTAGLQKVSAQLEASKPAPQVVLNNQ